MNTHDKYELPPLPKPAMNEGDTALYAAFAGSQLTDYARHAIEADRKRRGEPVAWWPIETAPHNEPVLLGWKDWDGAWMAEVSPATWGWCTDSVSNISQHGQATHWMPIPPQPTEPVRKTDWNNELSSWSDEDFIRIFHERPDLANRLRKMLTEPVKVPSEAKEALWKAYESLRELEKRIVLDVNQISGAAAASFAANRVRALIDHYGATTQE